MRAKNEERFGFGKNWQRYLKGAGELELNAAKESLSILVDHARPEGLSFLDIGSGSGLFSRAAYELRFKRVISFDYDPDSVQATATIRDVAGGREPAWEVRQGSVLDRQFMDELGEHDVVYSWGVLHHTGALWRALDNAARAVKPDGQLFVALYNDQGWISTYWHAVKRTYVRSPRLLRAAMVGLFAVYFSVGLFIADVLRMRNPLRRHVGDSRGMKFFTDVIDWVGGYPFEVTSPERVLQFLGERGFVLKWQRLVGSRHGCNEFVFRKVE